MTWRYDQNPGSDVTLLALYDAVLAAEEFDLAEQARLDAQWVEIQTLYDHWWDADNISDDRHVDDETDESVDRPRMSQAVGLIEHLLGGRSISER